MEKLVKQEINPDVIQAVRLFHMLTCAPCTAQRHRLTTLTISMVDRNDGCAPMLAWKGL
jgi:hypothetical protein